MLNDAGEGGGSMDGGTRREDAPVRGGGSRWMAMPDAMMRCGGYSTSVTEANKNIKIKVINKILFM